MPEVIILDLAFDVIIDSQTPYDPGRTYGPPENCYPPEGGELEWHVDEDCPIAEFVQAAIDNNEDWRESVEEQILDQNDY